MANLKEEMGEKNRVLQGFMTTQGNRQQIEIILKQEQEAGMEGGVGEITLQEIFQIIWSKLWLIVLCAAIGGGAAYYYTENYVDPVYDSYITMYVNNNSDRIQSEVNSGDINLSKQLVPTYMQILKSNTVLDEVVKSTGLGYNRNAIKGMISTSSVADTEIFRVQVTCLNAEHAAIIANAIGEVSPKEIIRITRAGSVEVIDYAEVPPRASSPNITLNGMIGVMLGGVVSVLLVLVMAMLDNRVKDEKQLQSLLGIPSLGEIPDFGRTNCRARRAKKRARKQIIKEGKRQEKEERRRRRQARNPQKKKNNRESNEWQSVPQPLEQSPGVPEVAVADVSASEE